jgi:hypothetical protein
MTVINLALLLCTAGINLHIALRGKPECKPLHYAATVLSLGLIVVELAI